jgi:phosphoribosylanthranilate isomerase
MFQSSVQIAGIKSVDEARMLEDLDTDFIGFPLRLGYHRPDTSEEEAREIISQLKAPRRAVLITYLTDAQDVETFARYLGVSTVQLHGDIELQQVKRLREKAPDIAIIKSLIVRPECVEPSHPIYSLAQALEPYVDAFITDTYDPKTGATGATGMRHDWRVSARVRDLIKKPLILAGGLTPDNVFEAIQQVRPAAVDAHTGVENSAGDKSPSLVDRFVREARRAFAHGSNTPRARHD